MAGGRTSCGSRFKREKHFIRQPRRQIPHGVRDNRTDDNMKQQEICHTADGVSHTFQAMDTGLFQALRDHNAMNTGHLPEPYGHFLYM